MQNALNIPLGITAGILISLLAWKAGSLSRSGAVAAAITGTVVILTVNRDSKKSESLEAKAKPKVELLPVAGIDSIGLNTTVHF